MAPTDFLMLCDGNIFNNETLREAHGGICRALHKSSKFPCGPGAATDFLGIVITVMSLSQWAQDHPPAFSAVLGKVLLLFFLAL